jgi:hypothetical protein
MTVKITNGLGSNIITNNLPDSQIIKAYTDAKVIKAETKDESMAAKPETTISFEKDSSNNVVPEGANEITQQPQTAETAGETSANARETLANQEEVEKEMTVQERRDAFKRANAEHQKAIKMQQEANEVMKKYQGFMEAMKKADISPSEMIKAIGKDPTDFMKRLQNEMFAIPNEPEKKQEPTVDERLRQYEQEREAERRQQAQYQSEMIKFNYIQNKILPAIANDEKYPLVMANKDKAAQMIYDIMNAHYLQFNEELNPMDVADEYEAELEKEVVGSIEKIKKINKFRSHFKEEQQPEEQTPQQLGQAPQKQWNGAKAPVPVKPGERTSSIDRAARKRRLMGI